MTIPELNGKLDSLVADLHYSALSSIPDNSDLPATMGDFNRFVDSTVATLSEFRKSIIAYLESN